MEPSTQPGSLQSRAEQYLRTLLQGCTTEEFPRRIVELASAQHENPVKELFRANDSVTLLSSGDNRQPEANAHRSKLSLRFLRNKDKAKAGSSTAVPEKTEGSYHNVFQADVKSSSNRDLEIVKQNLCRDGVAGSSKIQAARTKTSSSGHYNCVFCHTDYTTKGTCKRHLEEIHVAKRYFRCVMCRRNFFTAPEARKHCQSCGAGVLGWTTETPTGHKVYSSEFESHKIFSTQQAYINHLLDLSSQPPEGRPPRSWHLKLRNLLEQQGCLQAVESLSTRLFGSADGWRNVRWEHERVKKAVKDLERGILEVDLNPHDMLKLHRAEDFVTTLFNERSLATTVSADSLVREPAVLDEKAEMKVEDVQMPDLRIEEPQQQAEPTPKRPLSFESASIMPTRRPPGPPTPLPQAVAQMQQINQGNMYQYGYDTTSHHESVTQIEAAGFTIPQTQPTSSFVAQPSHEHMTFWPAEQHPPPYETGTAQPHQIQTSFAGHVIPQQSYAGQQHSTPYNDSNFMPMNDLAITSTMTSPHDIYIPAQGQNMALYAHPQQNHLPQNQIQQNFMEMPVAHPSANATPMNYSPMVVSAAPGVPNPYGQGAGHAIRRQEDEYHHVWKDR